MPTDERAASGASAARPVVLVGGRSRRFGRDKLREPWGGDGRMLVERPIAALREVLGPRVLGVGSAHASVRGLFEEWIEDDAPDRGPLGGIATALRRARGEVLVLAGDLPAIDAAVLQSILAAAASGPRAMAVVAETIGLDGEPRLHPCTALYRPSILPLLEARLAADRLSLLAMLRDASVLRVPCPACRLANANEPGDLASLR